MFQLLLLLGLGYLATRPTKTKKDTLVITDDPKTARGLRGGGVMQVPNVDLDIDLTEGQAEDYASPNREWGGTDDIGGSTIPVKPDTTGLGGGGSSPVDRPETTGSRDVGVSYIKDLTGKTDTLITALKKDKGTAIKYPKYDVSSASTTARRGTTKSGKESKSKGFNGEYSDFDGVDNANMSARTEFDGVDY